MFDISKTFAFSAAHRLTGLPDGHPCARVHGHNYVVDLRVQAADLTDPPGFVVDYADLAPFGAWLDDTFDHRWLGTGTLTDDDGTKTLPVLAMNPTAEHLAAVFRSWVLTSLPFASGPFLIEVGVSETPKTWAWAR